MGALTKVATVLLLGLAVDTEAEPLSLRQIAEAGASDVLRVASAFRAGPVGYAGVISEEEGALYRLLLSSSAQRELRRLASEASLPGQLYGLWGLAVLHDAEFDALAAAHASDTSDVDTQRGCIVDHESVSVIVERIRRGEYGRPRPTGSAAG